MTVRPLTFAILLTLLMMTTAAAATAAPPVRATVPVQWAWGELAGTVTTLRTESGISGHLTTSLSNPAADHRGLTVTLWSVVFNEPGECATSPCGPVDLFNPAVRGDVLYAAGSVVGASGRVTLGFHRSEGDNSGSIAALFGVPTDNGRPWGLIDARRAEIHHVVRSHGPLNPAAMPAQIQSYGGGCLFNAPFGHAFPSTGAGELRLGVGDCQDVQFGADLP